MKGQGDAVPPVETLLIHICQITMKCLKVICFVIDIELDWDKLGIENIGGEGEGEVFQNIYLALF